MRTTARQILALITLTLMCSTIASAELYHVELDLSSLGIGASVTDVELEVDLFENNAPYDSYALIDNVILGTAADDFEDGTLGGFDDWLNPGLIDTVAGNLDGTGSYVMRVDADFIPWPTIVYRDYFGRDGDVLSFDVESVLGPGDELVFSLLDPWTLDPLVSGVTGTGDFLALGDYYGDAGMTSVAGVDVDVVPVPGAALLALLGIGSAGLKLRRKK